MASTGLLSGMLDALAHNPYFSAGAGLFGVGATAAVARQAGRASLVALRRKLVVSVEVTARDAAYGWLLLWMERHVTSTQQWTLSTAYARHARTGRVDAAFSFLPSVGEHYFRYGTHWIKAERARDRQQTLGQGAAQAAVPWESVTLTLLGGRGAQAAVAALLREAKDEALRAHAGHTLIYTASGPVWRQSGPPRPQRPLSSVTLQGTLATTLLEDVRDFLGAAEWYSQRGVPYRRGYLLHGPPGCGKSSFVQALASELDYGICILSLGEMGLSDEHLQRLLADAPERSLILLEDVDAAFAHAHAHTHTLPEHSATPGTQPDPTRRTRRDMAPTYNTLTFSGLLNALDGVAAAEGRIIFMTTNYLARLDGALIRPGRIDRIEYLGFADRVMLTALWTRFYGPDAHAVLHAALATLPGGVRVDERVSMAQAQGLCLRHKNDARAAAEALVALLSTLPKSEE